MVSYLDNVLVNLVLHLPALGHGFLFFVPFPDVSIFGLGYRFRFRFSIGTVFRNDQNRKTPASQTERWQSVLSTVTPSIPNFYHVFFVVTACH